MVLGSSHKDIFTNRKITSKSFFNQSTIVLRRKINETCGEESWKEVNVKLFANGGIQMTGVTSVEFAHNAIEWLLNVIKGLPVSPFAEEASIQRFSVQLINTDYAINKFINQDALHKILTNDYNLFSMLEKTIYQGVNTKFFYNSRNPDKGICECEKYCKGQGTGDGEGKCKRITMSIFRTGRIIITGARELHQIDAAYNFLNKIFEKHHKTVLYEPNNA
jgi:TATA-box binding protein (TBP) (component of TFIID and TFIIIB)